MSEATRLECNWCNSAIWWTKSLPSTPASAGSDCDCEIKLEACLENGWLEDERRNGERGGVSPAGFADVPQSHPLLGIGGGDESGLHRVEHHAVEGRRVAGQAERLWGDTGRRQKSSKRTSLKRPGGWDADVGNLKWPWLKHLSRWNRF